MLSIDRQWDESLTILNAAGEVIATITVRRLARRRRGKRGQRRNGAQVVVEGEKEKLRILRTESWRGSEKIKVQKP